MAKPIQLGFPEDDYFFWDPNDPMSRAKAARAMSENIEDYEDAVYRSKASLYSRRQTYTNIDTKTSIRPEFGRSDYEYFRPGESIPTRPKDILVACDYYYWRVGIIKNIIDLMSDFACQGISIEHPTREGAAFFKKWFEFVDGRSRSERFLNTFYRLGNVVVSRTNGKLPARQADKMKSVQGAETRQIETDVPFGGKRIIPARYTILNPISLEVMGGNIATFTGKYHYELQLPLEIASIIRKHPDMRNAEERRMVAELDPIIRDALENGQTKIILDSDNLRTFHYKKDDWQVWATPFIHSVLEDIILLQKTKLCDLAALDGAISNVRLWNLGSLDHQLAPAPGAANRLARMLENNVGGGTIDIIWGPDLKLTESNSNIHQFLGKGKYEATLQNIYAGLGVPPTLTGASTANGFTNNYISLKTLVERLEYGRSALKKFWEYELAIVQRAMDFNKPAMIRFDRMTLSDETAERALLVQLLDRQVVSDETVLERFGEIPKLERSRIRKEVKDKENQTMPPKAGAFHNPQHTNDLEKIFAQSGQVAPSQVGVELKPKKKGEMTPLDLENEMIDKQHKVQMEQLEKQHVMQKDKSRDDVKIKDKDMQVMDKKMQLTDKNMENTRLQIEKMKYAPKGTPGQGRPKNSKDSKKRKTKVSKPRKSVKAEENNENPTEGV